MPASARAVTIEEAQEHLPDIVAAAEGGTVIPIIRKGKVVAEIRPVTRRLGCMAGSVEILGDIVAPLDEDWDANR